MIFNVLGGLLLAGLLVMLVTLCGLGLIRLVGMRQLTERALIAPVAALAVASIVIGITIQAGLPIRVIALYFWGAFALLAALGFKDLRNIVSVSILYKMGVAFLATVLVLGGYMYYGLLDFPGSPALDGWSYVSFGEYLRLYPRLTEGGLAPLYQYASHLSSTRYVASAMLALLIPPWSNTLDTQMMVGPFWVIVVFSFACSVAYVAQVANERGLWNSRGLTIFIAVVGGWLPYGLLANNYDNLLVLPMAPALFALAADRNLSGISRVIVPAVFSAAAIYIYPELAALILVGYFIAGMPSLFVKSNSRKQILLWLGIVGVTLVLISPYFLDAVKFFVKQLSAAAANRGARPGEGFMPNLLVPDLLPATIWGFDNTIVSIVFGVLLGAVAVAGIIAAVRARFYVFLVYLAVIMMLFMIMAAVKRYDYGAYKVFLLGWWSLAILLVAGGKYLWTHVPISNSRIRAVIRIAVSSVFFVAILLWGAQQYKWLEGFALKSMHPFREVREYVAGLHETVSVSVSETSRNAWLVYQLRDKPVIFTEYHGYMDQAHVRSRMLRSDVPHSNDARYLVVEEGKLAAGPVVWRNELFKVLKNEDAASSVTGSIDAPNGVERLDGATFFWVGRDPAAIILHSGVGLSIQLDIEIRRGPSAGEQSGSALVSIEQADEKVAAFNTYSIEKKSIRVMLHPGENKLVFRSIYGGAITTNSNGDPRVLVAGIRLLGLKYEH